MSAEDEYYVLGNIVAAVKLLEESKTFVAILPEVRSNLAMALPDASGPEQVAAIPGRITAVFGKPQAVGYPAFGASRNVARLLLRVMKLEPSIRAAIEIKYYPDVVEIAEKMGMAIVWADAEDETVLGMDPEAAQRRGRGTLRRVPPGL